jgi:membrane fusion protein (multidrug efflux system)
LGASARTALAWCLVALATAGAAGCSKADAEAAKEPAKAVRIQEVGRADIEEVLSYPADLKPAAEVHLFSRVPDRILSFPWDDGDEIKRGKRVAIIRTDSMSQGLEQLGAQIDALDVQIENHETELGRLEKLLSAGAIPQAEYDRLQTAYLAAKAQRRALKAGKGQLAVNASDGVITAPISGVIADKMVEEGDIAAPSVPLCRIIDVDQLKVELRLVEADVPKVKSGQEVLLHLDAFPKHTFRGKVTVVLPYLDQRTRTNTVEVVVDNPKSEKTGLRQLKPGMYGRAELVVERRPNVVVAPERALLLDNQILDRQKPGEVLRKAFVVDKQGTARKRIVKLGARNGTLWQVLSGLKQGDRLVVRGHHGLKDGQAVEVVESGKE